MMAELEPRPQKERFYPGKINPVPGFETVGPKLERLIRRALWLYELLSEEFLKFIDRRKKIPFEPGITNLEWLEQAHIYSIGEFKAALGALGQTEQTEEIERRVHTQWSRRRDQFLRNISHESGN